jgi:PAS domain S-box-containing protein
MWGSEEAFRLYGLDLTPSQVLPLDIVQSIPLAEHRPSLDTALTDLVAGRAPYDIEYRIRRVSDGVLRDIRSRAELVRRPDVALPLIVGTVQDITDRKAMEDAVRASEERYRMILEHAADAIFLGSAAGIAEANHRATTLTGYPREELVGMSLESLFGASELVRVPFRYDLIEQGAAVTLERMLTRKDGSTVPVEMHTVRLPDGVYQAIIRDISERRRLESQLQLRQRMDSIGTLASGIAHDFNNILVSILGYAELVRGEAGALSEGGRDAVDQVLTAARRAADLVRRLRTLARPEPPSKGSFDLHTVVSDALHVLAETTDRRIRKTCTFDAGQWFVRGSASDLYHALVNLAVNAVQAIEEKEISEHDVVTFDAAAYDATTGDPHGLSRGSYIRLSVSDTGAGMTPEVRARAFDPLFSTKSKGVRKGQGLGLTMVYNIVVTQHGGAIGVESEPGRGSTFYLYLPAGTVPQARTIEAPPKLQAGPATILLVEDEEQIASLAKRVLSGVGHRVIVATDGASALEQFGPAGEGVDLVILDQTLPRLSGVEVLAEMVRRRPEVRVVMSSGNEITIPETIGRPIPFLPKPYALGDLKTAVRKALSGPS